jgi:GNAT superfamily N-acetyltransferase
LFDRCIVLDSSFQDAPAAAARIQPATAADVPFIVDAIVSGARAGHFACDCSRPDVLQGLWHQIRTVVSKGTTPLPDARNGAGGRAFVLQVDQATAGFAILVEDAPGSWDQRVEVFAMAVHPAFRRTGLGRHLLERLVQDCRSSRVYARVAFVSVGMSRLLKSCGFGLGGESGAGTLTLEYRRPG